MNDVSIQEVSKLLEEKYDKDKTLSMLLKGKGSFINCYNSFTHRIHGKIDTLGAVTHRSTHSKPNLSQVTRGSEFRSFLCVPEGKIFVDVDASSLELAMLGNRLAMFDNGFYAEAVYSGNKDQGTDVHSITRDRLNLKDRDTAKTLVYQICYGAGSTPIGLATWHGNDFEYTQEEYNNIESFLQSKAILIDNIPYVKTNKTSFYKLSKEIILTTLYGSKVASAFRDSIVGYKELIEYLKSKIENNRIQGLDGRYFSVRSEHKTLNVILQSDGAIYMKYVMREAYEKLSKAFKWGRDINQILFIHDALSYEIVPEIKDEVDTILKQAFLTASEELQLVRPVKGEPSYGKNQLDAH